MDTTLAEKIVELRSKTKDEFSLIAADGAQRALTDSENPLRLNFFSLAMRILFEHMMDALAPKNEVAKTSWFKPETNDGKPSRGQRITFAIQGGLSEDFVRDKLKVDLPQLRKRLRDSVDELSKHVHARETTIIRDLSKQETLMENAVGATTAFLDTLEDCRTAIFTPIAEALDNAAVEALMSDSLEAVDELATHFSLDEVYVEDIKVAAIGAHALTYVVTGSAEVTLQWGSNLDLRAGDGAESSQSFPFRCELAVAVEDPWDLERAKSKCSVDTSAWHDMMTPDE